ncbi:methyl-accepting chemotaxis protein [Halanaerocella petrolearia]
MITDQKEIKVGIIGAGEVGTELLKIFLQMDSITVKYMADIDSETAGMLLAREEGVEATTEIMELIGDSTLDLIVEVTGSQEVLTTIEDEKTATTELISGEVSYLIFNIIQEYKELEGSLLQTVIKHLNEVYTSIESDSKNIKSLLNEINKITKNLNILAMNASIEAARAGKEGEGFSVVANEVKDLSSESNQIVGKIEEINTDIISLNEKISQAIDDLK